MPFGINVVLKGPIVEGRGLIGTERLTLVALAEVADYAFHEVQMELIHVLQNPTGYYESRIVKERAGFNAYSINDSNVIYGPWLEGIGSRNFPVTKFKGYGTFRRVRNRIAQKSGAIGEAAVARKIGGVLG
ncbi:hypothetical protein [Actinacidiphila rubida]|uniref:Uncharacterized protein n=1 Tax=Actinacidiphila rubida TaxID=310780 RepID=A0A1H8SXX5_9ACTN|nr:hypothetical protein [Actinacidiphila rubida]SEO83487.1 hypothetical protein SAMN05216267_104647 [Actinacidiphila rubida]